MPELTLSEEQNAVRERILTEPIPPASPFILTGLAGTGKTTIIATLEEAFRRACYCSPTGKAAQNLRKRGIPAITIHKAIYNHTHANGNPHFTKISPAELARRYTHFVIDEASMISTDIWRDLQRIRIPKILVGDPGQLPPVGDDPLLLLKPSAQLHTIHRNAANSPIIKLAYRFRRTGAAPDSPLLLKNDQGYAEICSTPTALERVFSLNLPLEETMFLTGRNKERVELNTAVRQWRGIDHAHPISENDQLVCRRNNYNLNVFNGQLFKVLETPTLEAGVYPTIVEPIDGGEAFELPISAAHFNKPKVDYDDPLPQGTAFMNYGYALTVHYAQGSEFQHVVVIEPPGLSYFVGETHRWRYTAATRAVETLVYASPKLKG